MKRHLTTYATGLIQGILLVILVLLASCGNDPAKETDQILDHKADPQSVANEKMRTKLTQRERDLLVRANGRNWEQLSSGDLENLLHSSSDTTRALYIWDPQTGANGLRDIQQVASALSEKRIVVAVASQEGTDARGRLIALRESQVVLPAYLIPSQRLPDGQEAKPGKLYVAVDGEKQLKTFGPGVPPDALQQLLSSYAPL